ncbi:unnamed protein product [Caenorhabditis angaria]|uniref:T-cell activation inhibitor, mitochondrial n=1 Tax=Caenorhabditis angaria TaxID=860376 RepID=A0A9P1J2Q1_9PELO|nr:unnamed protein product [Caenorhabditis angaria]
MIGSPRKMRNLWMSSRRYLTLNEVSVALRPFFFVVHPDRYAKHPEIRSQNEKSLQVFNGYINDLFPISPSLKPTKVSFSIVDKKDNEKIRLIQIQLTGTDPSKIVREALQSCQISTKDLNEKFAPSSINSNSENLSDSRYTTSNIDEDLLTTYLKRKKKSVINNLHASLTNQRDEAVRKSKEAKNFRISIKEDIDELKNRTGLKDVVWQMDWAETHMRRCLLNMHRFLDTAESSTKDAVIQTLYKNVLRFGRGSYTCCDGSIQLGADNVPEQWEQACCEHSVRKSQLSALRQATEQLAGTFGGAKILLPHYKGLAQTLSQIQSLIVRIWRKEALLVRLANAAAGSMIEVVTSYDELAIGLDGRLYVPCNVDVASLVVFLEENAEKAAGINHHMQALLNELEYSKDECVQDLNLQSLSWESTFNPEKLLVCVNRLKNSSEEIQKMASGLSIRISNNPTIHVTNDGTLSVPIDWV